MSQRTFCPVPRPMVHMPGLPAPSPVPKKKLSFEPWAGSMHEQFSSLCMAFKAALKGLSRICAHTGCSERTWGTGADPARQPDEKWEPAGARHWAIYPSLDKDPASWTGAARNRLRGHWNRTGVCILSMELEIRSERGAFYMFNICWCHFCWRNDLNICWLPDGIFYGMVLVVKAKKKLEESKYQ